MTENDIIDWRRQSRRQRFGRLILRLFIVGNFIASVLFVALAAAILSRSC